jgi:hypothetical protein
VASSTSEAEVQFDERRFYSPPNYSPHFTSFQINLINNKSLYIDLVLLDYTWEGFLAIEFIFAEGIQV